MGATLSAATCTIFGPTFPVQSNAITLRFAHRRLGPKLIAVAAQLTKIKYSHLHRPVTHSLYSWPIWGRAGAAGNDFSWLRPNALALASCHIPCTVVLENLLMAEPTNPLVAFSDHAAQLVERIWRFPWVAEAAEKACGRGYSGRRHRNSGLVSTRRRLARNATRHERPTPPRPSREAQARGLAWSCRIVLLSPDPRSTLVRTRSASSSTTMILRSPEGVLDRGPPRGAPRRLAGTPALRLSLIELALNQVTRIEKRFIRRSRCRNG